MALAKARVLGVEVRALQCSRAFNSGSCTVREWMYSRAAVQDFVSVSSNPMVVDHSLCNPAFG
eukprot:scaffold187835_cov18-Prasinocladus_malaysianus.AAC.1